MITHPAITLFNHLLVQSGWALPRLARFGGRTVRFEGVPFLFACTIQEDGALREAAAEVPADATFTLSPTLLPRLALRDEAAIAQIKSAGDAALIEEVLFLIRNLRWDVAEDISRITGDIAAERIVRATGAGARQARDAALNLSRAAAEYWTEERPLLAAPPQVKDFGRDVETLRAATARLEQRIDQLTKVK